MKVLVCGGRDYKHEIIVRDALDSILRTDGIKMVIHGDASGADFFAGQWAFRNGIQEVRCPANWKRHGKAAGPIRNEAMLLLQPDLVIAFPGGTGTANMVKQAKAAGVRVIEVAE